MCLGLCLMQVQLKWAPQKATGETNDQGDVQWRQNRIQLATSERLSEDPKIGFNWPSKECLSRGQLLVYSTEDQAHSRARFTVPEFNWDASLTHYLNTDRQM